MPRGKILTASDLTAIQAGCAAGKTAAEIGKAIGRPETTVQTTASKRGWKFLKAPKEPKQPAKTARARAVSDDIQRPSTPEDTQAILSEMAVDKSLSAADRIRALTALLDSLRRDGGRAKDETSKLMAQRLEEIRRDAQSEPEADGEPLAVA